MSRIVEIIREELARYRRQYRHAEQLHRADPYLKPDRRERWYGAVGALERLLRRMRGE